MKGSQEGSFDPDLACSGQMCHNDLSEEDLSQHGSGSAPTAVVGSVQAESCESSSESASEVVDTEESSGGEIVAAVDMVEATATVDPNFSPTVPEGGLLRR